MSKEQLIDVRIRMRPEDLKKMMVEDVKKDDTEFVLDESLPEEMQNWQ